MRRKRVTLVGIALLSAVLGMAACSGGGDSEPPAAADPAQRVEGLTCSSGARSGWCWLQPRPRGNSIADLAFVDAQRAWAVGEAGLIMHTADGGASWVQQSSGTRHGLHQVRFLNASVGFAAGNAGTVLRTSDGGAHWTRWPLEAEHDGLRITRLGLVNEREVLVAGTHGAGEWLLRLRDARVLGQVNVDLNSLSIEAGGWASWRSDGELWALPESLEQALVHRAAEAGWMVKASGAVGPGRLWAFVGRRPFADPSHGPRPPEPNPDDDPVLWSTDDGGATWQSSPVEFPSGQGGLLLWSAQLFAGGSGWAWSAAGGLLRTEDGGRRWHQAASLPPETQRPGFSFGRPSWFVDAQTVQVSAGEQTWLSLDAARSWHVPTPVQRYRFWAEQYRRDMAGGLLAIESSGLDQRLHRSLDGGRSWRLVGGVGSAGPFANDVGSVVFLTPLQGLMARGPVLRSTQDGGMTWQHVQDLAPGDCADCQVLIQRPRDGSLWRTRGGRLARSPDQGANWVAVPLPAQLQYPYYLSITDAQVLWAQAAAGLFRSLDGGANWRHMPVTAELLANGVTRLAFADADVGVLISGRGEVWRSADGGMNWQRVPTELSLPRSGRIVWTDARSGWILGGEGALLRSTDAGLSWQAVSLPVRVRMIDLHFAGTQRGWMVGEGGVILATEDGGRRWTLQPSGTEHELNSVWALDPANVWVGGSSGTLLTSATGGW